MMALGRFKPPFDQLGQKTVYPLIIDRLLY